MRTYLNSYLNNKRKPTDKVVFTVHSIVISFNKTQKTSEDTTSLRSKNITKKLPIFNNPSIPELKSAPMRVLHEQASLVPLNTRK